MTNRSDSTQAACSHLTVKYTTEEIGGLTRGWWECKDCKTKFIPAACAPPSSSSGELPKWVRQESCPECDGDGCNFCESRAVAPTPSVFTWSMKACPKEIGAMMNPSADWSISGPNGEWTYFSSDELEKLSKGHLQIIPLERLSELKSTAAPSVSTKPPRPEELLECQNPVYLKLRKIYCCKGAEFCRTELQEAWLEIAKLDWQLNHPAARPSGDGQPALLHKPNDPLPEGCFCQPGKCAAPVIMGRQMPCPDPQKAAGIVRCCENGNFGDGHECRKQPPEPASQPVEGQNCKHCQRPIEQHSLFMQRCFTGEGMLRSNALYGLRETSFSGVNQQAQPVEGQQAQGGISAHDLARKMRELAPEWNGASASIEQAFTAFAQLALNAMNGLAAHPPAEPRCPKCKTGELLIEHECQNGDYFVACSNHKCAFRLMRGPFLVELAQFFARPSGEGDR